MDKNRKKIEWATTPIETPQWMKAACVAEAVILLAGLLLASVGNNIGWALVIFSVAGGSVVGGTVYINGIVKQYKYEINFERREIKREFEFGSWPLAGAFRRLYGLGDSLNLKGTPTVSFDKIRRIEYKKISGRQMIQLKIERFGGSIRNWFMEVPEERGEEIYQELKAHVPDAK